MAPSNAPLCCANRWHATTALHLCVAWHVCLLLAWPCALRHCLVTLLPMEFRPFLVSPLRRLLVVSPRFLLAAPVEQHLCMDAAPACTSAPLTHCSGGLYVHCSWGPLCRAWGLAWVFMNSTHSQHPALQVCTAQGYCPDSALHCTRSQVLMCTLLGVRAQSPCPEFTVPHAPSPHAMLMHVSTPVLVSNTYSAPWGCVELIFPAQPLR